MAGKRQRHTDELKAHVGLGQELPTFLLDADLRLILFGGKGGVGKTTCAAAAALHLAEHRPEETFAAVSIDPAHSLKDSFAGSSLPSNLTLTEIDAQACLNEFKRAHAEHLRQIARRGTFFDDGDIDQLIDLSLPGLDEIMAFNEIAELAEGMRFACVIVDTAPTGHTLRFLELPDIMQDWVQTLDVMLQKHRYMVKLYRGLYRSDETDAFLNDLSERIERLGALLQDREGSHFVPVLTPDSLTIQETRNLLKRLESLNIPVHDMLVNRIYPGGTECSVCLSTSDEQSSCLQSIVDQFSTGYSLWQTPLMGAQVQGREELASFWDAISGLDSSYEHVKAKAKALVPPRVEDPPRLPTANLSVLLFAGKGGVGKTTLSCATALRLAEEHKSRRVLLLSTDPACSLSDCLEVPVGRDEKEVFPGLTAMELDAQEEFDRLKALYADEVADFFRSLTSGGGIDLKFDREVIERILDLSPPGIDEVMALTRVIELMEADKYDMFVLDTAPTGHLIRLLEFPELIEQWLQAIFGLLLKYKNVLRLPKVSDFLVDLSKKTKRLRSILTDKDNCWLCGVSIPTQMALEETRDLLAACRRVGVHVPILFLNMVTQNRDCPTCRALADEETNIRKEFAREFADLERPVIYRCPELEGRERLANLGRVLYRK